MQKWILWIVLSGFSFNAYAKDCSVYHDKIRKLEDLRRSGGSLKQMERWRIQADEAANKERQCNKSGAIQIASGSSVSASKNRAKNTRSAQQKLRKSNNQNPQVQQLLSTCNYWIAEQNNNPSADNNTFRDTACRALDDKLATADEPTPVELANLRSLRDCIKPNNLIDSDVQECRQGLREPSWKHP